MVFGEGGGLSAAWSIELVLVVLEKKRFGASSLLALLDYLDLAGREQNLVFVNAGEVAVHREREVAECHYRGLELGGVARVGCDVEQHDVAGLQLLFDELDVAVDLQRDWLDVRVGVRVHYVNLLCFSGSHECLHVELFSSAE